MYVTIRPLVKKSGETIPKDTRTKLDGLSPKSIAKLKEVGAIRELQSPPLRELAGWKRRSVHLEQMDIITVLDFLEADSTAIAKQLRVKPGTVDRWKSQLEGPQPEKQKKR